jgi:hypothetical protein
MVKQVCSEIWNRLKPVYMPKMTTEKWEQVSEGFTKYANSPNCAGAIDGKPIRIVQSSDTGSLYYNYKKYFSTVLLAVCDANCCFIFVDTGGHEKTVIQLFFKNHYCTRS